ncbi:MAG TPA: glycosyltransferase [Candidatus Sulfotelmatobacter sp.]|nr:glycosyltransferase [Candidatus Sulfotelmatobacter sp.]
MPKVSVIVPNYNHARFLCQRIDSILAQTFQDFELILLDDCSTDDSRSILSSYANNPRVRIEFNAANSGSTFKQWNKGVRLASGEYVWIAESDDYADQRFLERLVAVLDADPRVVLANCRSWRADADGRVDGYGDAYLSGVDQHKWTMDFNSDGKEECSKYFVRANPICNASSVLSRRSVYLRVGGADESLRFCGDWKLWAGMALTGRVAYLSEPLNYFRAHDTSVTAESARLGLAAAEYLRVIRWLLIEVTPTSAVLHSLYKEECDRWVPAVMSMHVPLRVKWSILRDVMAIDPHPMLRAIRPASAILQLKFARHFTFPGRVGSKLVERVKEDSNRSDTA